MHRVLRRPALFAATALCVLTSACGGDDDEPAAAGGQSAPAASASAFPAEIEHRFGTTTIPSEPKRIVTLGYTDQDAFLALGSAPVATTDWMGFEGGVGPWATEALGDAPMPKLLKDTDGIPVEEIASLEPDLITALYSDLTRKEFAMLSNLAPVLAPPEGTLDFGIDWRDTVRVAGEATGKADEAAELVADVEGQERAAAEEHPEFRGQQAAMAMYFEGYWVYGPTDPRMRLLETLGFEIPPAFAKLTDGQYAREISSERLDLLDVDALVWLNEDADQKYVDADPLYTDLSVEEEGRAVVAGSELSKAIGFVSPLSLPYTLEHLVPALGKAVDGDPATPAEPSTS